MDGKGEFTGDFPQDCLHAEQTLHTDRSTDIAKALDEAAKANPWAFDEDGAAGVAVVSTGAEHGAPPANEFDGVEAAFKSLNPELNL